MPHPNLSSAPRLSGAKECRVKRILLLSGVVALLAGIGCVVDAGVDVGAGGGDACVAISCGDALASGLPAQGDVICDGVSDDAYSQIVNCACGGGSPCADVCADNLCVDLGETSDCGDCLAQACAPEHDTCANN
jgi:hypothetical protein